MPAKKSSAAFALSSVEYHPVFPDPESQEREASFFAFRIFQSAIG